MATKSKKTNLMAAHNQWAMRPADERFWTVAEMRKATKAWDDTRKVEEVPLGELTVGDDMSLAVAGQPVGMTHWAFGQMCHRADVPAPFIRTLPPALAAQVVRHGLVDRLTPAEKTKAVRVSLRGGDVAESFMSSRFSFIPDWQICDGLAVLERAGWKVPPPRPVSQGALGSRPATKADVSRCGTRVKEGEIIAPAGLYASDRDMFAFMVNEEESQAIDDGTGNPLRRGIFISNSEVGAAAFRVTAFLFDEVCGNHIVWGATDVVEVRIIHAGTEAAVRAFAALSADLAAQELDVGRLERTIGAARKTILGKDEAAVVERLVDQKRLYVGKSDAREAFRIAAELDGDRVDPCSVWGMVSGFTRLSQREQNSDRRVMLDHIGAGLMRIVDPEAKCGIVRRRASETTVEAEVVQ